MTLWCDDIIKAFPEMQFKECCGTCHTGYADNYIPLLGGTIEEFELEVCCSVYGAIDEDDPQTRERILMYARSK